MQKRIEKGLRLYREWVIERGGVDETARTVQLSFSSEAPISRWGSQEILDHAPGAADISRLASMGVVLFNHDYNRVIGGLSDVRIENGRGLGTISFDDDEFSDMIYKKVLRGTLKGVSVGYTIDDYIYVSEGTTTDDGRFRGPCYLITKWRGLEVSVVSVPADDTVGIGRANEIMAGGFEDQGLRSLENYKQRLIAYEAMT